jgi:hypothetical protein
MKSNILSLPLIRLCLERGLYSDIALSVDRAAVPLGVQLVCDRAYNHIRFHNHIKMLLKS